MTSPSRLRAFSYVRMSTDAQLKGDSLRRQLEQSRDYAAQQGWDLLEGDQLRDIGISAFKGDNVRGGALGLFLAAVRDRRVEPGSVLIIESLDRLSRQEVLKSLGVFIEILNAGVSIVTLADGKTYTAGTGFEELIFSIVSMGRAHEESRTKSIRVRAAWANKRKNASTSPLTAQCPGWLKLSSDRTKYEVIRQRADLVLSIFRDSAAGMGNYSITRRLNQARVQPFGSSRGWRSSSVNKILTNRAVLGEFQPHRLVDGRRVPDGDPVQDYFPTIIDEQLFYRAQDARGRRRIKGAGRKGPGISNLFSGLATCAYCGSRMAFKNKGTGPKGGSYIVCDAAGRGLGCEKVLWRYDAFEKSFLAFVRELDLESIVHDEDEARKRSILASTITALRGEQAAIKEQMERTYELINIAGNATSFVAEKLQILEARRAAVEAELREREQERSRLRATRNLGAEQIRTLVEQIQSREGDELYKLRSQIESRLRSLVSTILVAPLGHAPLVKRTVDVLSGETGVEPVIEHLRSTIDDRRYFSVGFVDGTTRARIVWPNRDDPLKFEQQMVGEADGIGVIYPVDNA
jgi:DNA invertase Pin-like site-specific DNA recombinase